MNVSAFVYLDDSAISWHGNQEEAKGSTPAAKVRLEGAEYDGHTVP